MDRTKIEQELKEAWEQSVLLTNKLEILLTQLEATNPEPLASLREASGEKVIQSLGELRNKIKSGQLDHIVKLPQASQPPQQSSTPNPSLPPPSPDSPTSQSADFVNPQMRKLVKPHKQLEQICQDSEEAARKIRKLARD